LRDLLLHLRARLRDDHRLLELVFRRLVRLVVDVAELMVADRDHVAVL
jgi:hypothetical protein